MSILSDFTTDHFLEKDKITDFICPICLSVMFEIYELNNCGHLFCKDCIKRLKECSLCKNDKVRYHKSKYLKRKFYEQNVKCYVPSCDKIFTLSEAKQHFTNCHQMNVINSKNETNIIINNEDHIININTGNNYGMIGSVEINSENDIIDNNNDDFYCCKITTILIAFVIIIYTIYKLLQYK